MSKKPKKPRTSLINRPGYDVGYGKPPQQTRFKKGQSGNARGRPKGAKNKQPGYHEERLKEIIMEEAYRGIDVREGDRTVTLPMAQTVMRSIAVNAAKGNTRAQRQFVELVSTTESALKAISDEDFKVGAEYKAEWERELKRRKDLGITDLPDPVIHPDQIEIDIDNQTATIRGPRTREEKAAVDYMIARRTIYLDRWRDITRKLARAKTEAKKRELEKKLRDVGEILEMIHFFEIKPNTEQ